MITCTDLEGEEFYRGDDPQLAAERVMLWAVQAAHDIDVLADLEICEAKITGNPERFILVEIVRAAGNIPVAMVRGLTLEEWDRNCPVRPSVVVDGPGSAIQ